MSNEGELSERVGRAGGVRGYVSSMSAGFDLRQPSLRRPSAANTLRVGLLAHVQLDGRRVADVLEREGMGPVCSTGSPEELIATGVALDVLVVTMRETPAADEWLPLLADRLREIPVVVVSSAISRGSIDNALEQGVRGLVSYEDVEERLGPTVRGVAVGQLVIPSEHRGVVAQPIFSSREKQVLSMVVLGFSNGEVANKLFVAETTVKSHLSSAYRKLGVHSRHEAASLILSDKGLGFGILAISDDRASG